MSLSRLKENKNAFPWLMLTPCLVFLLLFLLVPILLLVDQSLTEVDGLLEPLPGFSLTQYIAVFTQYDYLYALWTTLWVSVLTALLTVLLAWPAAWLLVTTRRRTWRTLLYIILISPLLTSVVIRTFAWIVLLAQNGLVNSVLMATSLIPQPLSLLWNMNAVIIAYVQVMLPFAVLPLITSLNEMAPSLRLASMSLGATPSQTFRWVVLPLTLPGMVTGFVIVFSLAAGSYITPLLIGGRLQPLLPISIYQQAMQIANLPMAAALSLTLLVMTLLVAGAAGQVLKRWERKNHGH
ncbi:ABC transporter permease [Pectobacterium brasiliense]|uniref:ABC transporter permease n=1 Tax=Pectobacterium TaxID=122277 RepID=UPI0001A43405|nr:MULTISPECIES: ABC transporter permease [Pectobacterium]KGA23550.1 ABC transporter permease [Pectobacterium brasiliense]KRF64239.1 ABC transporter permease [Pectobacterium brasiliense]MBN3187303.1 ABC transporter permease [Pectobacterium brasiliense]MBN3189415.1 ABC transporter permease [Pectobacterium brasiliense]MBN3264621.1 ABC transporter permease [Pectobacterium brasiliense]